MAVSAPELQSSPCADRGMFDGPGSTPALTTSERLDPEATVTRPDAKLPIGDLAGLEGVDDVLIPDATLRIPRPAEPLLRGFSDRVAIVREVRESFAHVCWNPHAQIADHEDAATVAVALSSDVCSSDGRAPVGRGVVADLAYGRRERLGQTGKAAG